MDRTIHGTRRALGRALGTTLALLLLLATATAAAGDTSAPGGVVNVNTASVEELQLLPGIGEARARAIVEARKQRGGFASIDDLREVKGIGEASLERLRPHVVLEGRTTAGR